jgi:hypothetical protein
MRFSMKMKYVEVIQADNQPFKAGGIIPVPIPVYRPRITKA